MAFLQASERTVFVTSSPVFAVGQWFANVLKAHRHRVAMLALLDMENGRLNDIGVERSDIVATLAGGPSLYNRRAQRARTQTWS